MVLSAKSNLIIHLASSMINLHTDWVIQYSYLLFFGSNITETIVTNILISDHIHKKLKLGFWLSFCWSLDYNDLVILFPLCCYPGDAHEKTHGITRTPQYDHHEGHVCPLLTKTNDIFWFIDMELFIPNYSNWSLNE